MSWRDRLRPGSFRGARFYIDRAGRRGGRKAVTHEYPKKDKAYVEDMGMAPRRFRLEMHVIGDSYFEARDAMIKALEAPGPGTLMHPYQGQFQVALEGPFAVEESTEFGGMAIFSVEFVETDQAVANPVAAQDFLSRVVTAADSAVASVREAFISAYDVVAQAQFAIDSLSQTVSDAGSLIKGAIGSVLAVPQSLAHFGRAVDGFIDDAGSIARLPDALADTLGSVLDFGTQSSNPRAAVSAYLAIYAFVPAPIAAPITATRIKEHANQDAITALVRQSALIEAARLAPTAIYDSYEDAISVRDAIVNGLDAESETASDDVFSTLTDLRAEVVKAVPGDDNALARLISITPLVTVPSLALVYDLYESLDREQDVIQRNDIRHPGFIPGGVKLEVLSSVS